MANKFSHRVPRNTFNKVLATTAREHNDRILASLIQWADTSFEPIALTSETSVRRAEDMTLYAREKLLAMACDIELTAHPERAEYEKRADSDARLEVWQTSTMRLADVPASVEKVSTAIVALDELWHRSLRKRPISQANLTDY